LEKGEVGRNTKVEMKRTRIKGLPGRVAGVRPAKPEERGKKRFERGSKEGTPCWQRVFQRRTCDMRHGS